MGTSNAQAADGRAVRASLGMQQAMAETAELRRVIIDAAHRLPPGSPVRIRLEDAYSASARRLPL